MIKENKMWLGCSIHSGDREFRVSDDYPWNTSGFQIDDNGVKYIHIKDAGWFIKLITKESIKLVLYKNTCLQNIQNMLIMMLLR